MTQLVILISVITVFLYSNLLRSNTVSSESVVLCFVFRNTTWFPLFVSEKVPISPSVPWIIQIQFPLPLHRYFFGITTMTLPYYIFLLLYLSTFLTMGGGKMISNNIVGEEFSSMIIIMYNLVITFERFLLAYIRNTLLKEFKQVIKNLGFVALV